GGSLEWATSCPPPRHNFTSLPRIRSERPAFDLHHPEVAAMDHIDPDPGPLTLALGDADRRGEQPLAQDRVVNGTDEEEESAMTVEPTPGQDVPTDQADDADGEETQR